jgi:hypothetical protein
VNVRTILSPTPALEVSLVLLEAKLTLLRVGAVVSVLVGETTIFEISISPA